MNTNIGCMGYFLDIGALDAVDAAGSIGVFPFSPMQNAHLRHNLVR